MRIEDSIYRYGPIVPTSEQSKTKTQEQHNETSSFEEILRNKLTSNEITFSKHAMQRIEQREMHLTGDDIQQLGDAVKSAEEKGVTNTLVLSSKGAFIVNVPNNTVITAMNPHDMKGNVFTQIDGAVFI